MKNIYLVISALLASLPASATSTEELVTMLIKNASKIKAVDAEDGSKVDLLPLLVGGMISDHLSRKEGERVVITDVSSTCTNITPSGLLGAKHEECTLHFSDGDYLKTKTGYEGPEAESGFFMTLQISTPVAPKAKPSLKQTNIKVTFAG